MGQDGGDEIRAYEQSRFRSLADAIARAAEQFNSAGGIYGRAPKDVSPQEALGNKATEVANAEIQARNAETKTAAFKLPESDAVAKANADAMSGIAKGNRKKGEAENLTAAQLGDIEATASQGLASRAEIFLQPRFWKYVGYALFNHPTDFWRHTSGEMEQEQKRASASDIETANSQTPKAERKDPFHSPAVRKSRRQEAS